jgi:hypothetical protein
VHERRHRVSRQRLKHLDEFFASVAAAAAELEQLFHPRHDGAALSAHISRVAATRHGETLFQQS